MAIPPELEAQILRYYHAEQWRVGTIATQLRVHHSVVARVLAQAGLPHTTGAPRPSQIDPYLSFLRETLAKFPRLTDSRLYAMVRARGYPGDPHHFRYLVSRHRPRPPPEGRPRRVNRGRLRRYAGGGGRWGRGRPVRWARGCRGCP